MGEPDEPAGLPLERARPGEEEVVTFAAGRFASAAPPSWYAVAVEAADRRGVPWPQAVTDATGCSEPRVLPIEPETRSDLAVWCWLTPEGGRYVEIVDATACQLAVYVPDPADWPAFWAGWVVPALELQLLASLRRVLLAARRRPRRRALRKAG
jgi:hypothetical protein